MSFDAAFMPRYENVIAPAINSIEYLDEPLEPHRVDLRTISNSVLTEIEGGLSEYRLIFVDITTIGKIEDKAIRSANVMYELGIAHAVRLPEEVLVFRSDNDFLPFDTTNIRVNWYAPDDDMEAAIEEVQACINDALTEIELVRHKLVDDIVAHTDVASLMMLSDAATPQGLSPPPRKTMGEVVSNLTRSSTLMRMLDRGLITADFVSSTPATWGPDTNITDFELETLQVYRITPLGDAVRKKLAKKLVPSLAPFVAQYEEPKKE